ncbi:hypothetical protein AVEN_241961-1 [Araneus ventricosus]|uniref:Uncharacterized protein n=1 Tax=Araneus ventricosus TaxID=182803 RepID=A0A4Y2QB16_ARAVE|nr:hypothetical protein AVEN_241961-1 [Araneus ventricosus]
MHRAHNQGGSQWNQVSNLEPSGPKADTLPLGDRGSNKYVFGTQIGCRIWAVSGVAPDFTLELLQQFLSFASSMGIVMQDDDTITQQAITFMAVGFTIAQ